MLRTSLTILISFSFLCACASEQAVETGSVGDVPVDAAPTTNEEPVLTDAPIATDAPVATDAPIATDAPVATDVPVAIDVPVVAPEPMPVVVAEPIPALVPPDAPTPVAEPTPTPAPTQEPRFDVEFFGEDVFVSINGQRVAKEHLRRTSDSIEIIGNNGQVLQTILIPQPKEHPPVMIGVRFETTGKALTKHLGSDVSNCALVVAVMENGPGYMSGIEDFDLVTAVDGKTPATPEAIRDRLKVMTPGDSIVLTIRRGKIIKDYSLVSKAWMHVPLPAELQTPPITRKSSPILQGTPNMPSNSNSNGRPAAAPQQTVAPNS